MGNYQMQTLSPNLMVKDVTASINFYHNILGFDILMKIPEDNSLYGLVAA